MNDHILNDTDRFDLQEDSDDLDALLRAWHEENAVRARASRDVLIAQLARRTSPVESLAQVDRAAESQRTRSLRWMIWKSPSLRAAASLALIAVLAVFLVPRTATRAEASNIINVPNGGALNAYTVSGQLVGPCPLTHTRVDIEVTGPFSRITVTQQYYNPYQSKIEAVYTFPLSHRAAVDRMKMSIDGERVIEGEIKERGEARRIYEQAKAANHVAALLEQERPNIFTQSIANIEPGASIDIEISYIETVEQIDGGYSLAFPMTVAPRYIPGYRSHHSPSGETDRRAPLRDRRYRTNLPNQLELREGVILRAPNPGYERLNIQWLNAAEGAGSTSESLGDAPFIQHIIDRSVPIEPPSGEWRSAPEQQEGFKKLPSLDFNVHYPDGTSEFGQIAGDGVAHIGSRWFWFDRSVLDLIDLEQENGGLEIVMRKSDGTGYKRNTNQVPDASRITPRPVRPALRAGHDISLSVRINTGGPKITSVNSELHEIAIRQSLKEADADDQREEDADNITFGSTLQLELRNENEIPNRDFVLHWTVDDSQIQESTFVHASEDFQTEGGFFTLMLAPPARVEPNALRSRELIFVMDTSGSMKGEPIAKSKSVLTRAIDAMREGDTFNIMTFASEASVLWDKPRPNTNKNRAEALTFINSRAGNGGTEIMKAINLALQSRDRKGAGWRDGQAIDKNRVLTGAALTLAELANLPADNRQVRVQVPFDQFQLEAVDQTAFGQLIVRDDLKLDWTTDTLTWGAYFAARQADQSDNDKNTKNYILTGNWNTTNGVRTLSITEIKTVRSSSLVARSSTLPMRIAIFLTDGEVGNDMVVIDAVKENARTTRVFALGVGDSVNRYLLANMAHAGRGEVEFVTQQSDRGDAVDRLVQRIDAPVLTDIELEFSDGLAVTDIMPRTPGGLIPDVYDHRPIIIHGRFATPASGTLTIRGMTGDGPWERTIELDFSEGQPNHDVTKTLWARAKIDELTNQDLTGVQLGTLAADQKKTIVDLAVNFGLLSQFTSFIAVEKARVTIDGRSRLITIPIELPDDADFSGYFGTDGRVRDDVVRYLVDDVYLSTRVTNVESSFDWLAEPGESFEALVQRVWSDESEQQEYIYGKLVEVRAHQLKREHDEALRDIDRILFVDEANPVALPLRDAIQTAKLWESFLSTEKERELGYSWQFQNAREASHAPKSGVSELGRGYTPADVALNANISSIATRLDSGSSLIDELVEQASDESLVGFRHSLGEHNIKYRLGVDEDGNAPQQTDVVLRTQYQLLFGEENTDQAGAALSGSYMQYTPTTTPVLRRVHITGGNLININSARSNVLRALPRTPIKSDDKLGVDKPNNFGIAAGSDTGVFRDITLNQRNLDIVDGDGAKNPYVLWHSMSNPMVANNGFVHVPTIDMRLLEGFESQQWFVDPSEKMVQGLRSTTGLMSYPTDWPQTSITRSDGSDILATESDHAVAAAIENTVLQHVLINDNTLEQVLAYIALNMHVNVHADWKSLEQIGVFPNTRVHDIDMRDVSTRVVLERILEQLGDEVDRAGYSVQDGLLVILSEDAIRSSGSIIETPDNPTHHSESGGTSSNTRPIDIIAEQIDRAAELARLIDEASQSKPGANDDEPADTQEPGQEQTEMRTGPPPIVYVLNPRDSANARFYFERAAILIVDLARADHFEQATLLATWLTRLDSAFALGNEIKEILDDESLGNTEKLNRLEPLAERAKGAIGNSIRLALMQREVERRVSDELLALVINAKPQAAGDTALVSILVEDTNDEMIESLRAAGLEVDDIAKSARIIVGEANVTNLPRIALTPGVQRVELVH